MRASDVHLLLGREGWPPVLASLGIPEDALTRKKNRPCPACGGTDRYSFDNRRGRGDFFCRQCGPGSGFDLLMRVHGWNFRTALAQRDRSGAAGRRCHDHFTPAPVSTVRYRRCQHRAQPTARWRCCDLPAPWPIAPAARRYLRQRRLWPLPSGHALRAHVGAEYWREGQRVGRFAALIAPVIDVDGILITLHVHS